MCKKIITILLIIGFTFCSFSMFLRDTAQSISESDGICDLQDDISEAGPDIISKIQIIPNEQISFGVKDYIGQIPRTVQHIIKYLNNLERYKTNTTRTLLLYGPPGTGKTNIAKAIAKETKRTLLKCSASDILTKWAGSGANSVRNIFEHARKQENKTILFIDEIDSGTCDRAQEGNKHYSQSLISLTNQLDLLIEDNEVPIFVIVTTNIESDLDSALISRLTSAKINLPSIDDRRQMLKLWIANKGLTISEEILNKIVELTDKFSGRDIKNLLNNAELELEDDSKNLKDVHFSEKIKEIQTMNEEKSKKLNIDKQIKELQLESLIAQKTRLEQEDRIRQLQEKNLLEELALRKKQEIRMEEEHKIKRMQAMHFLDQLETDKIEKYLKFIKNYDNISQHSIKTDKEDQSKTQEASSCVIS